MRYAAPLWRAVALHIVLDQDRLLCNILNRSEAYICILRQTESAASPRLGDKRGDSAEPLLRSDLVEQAAPLGNTPSVLTAYTKLSVAGTLTVGGLLVSNKDAQIDQVRALQVVTGEGNVLWCAQSGRA